MGYGKYIILNFVIFLVSVQLMFIAQDHYPWIAYIFKSWLVIGFIFALIIAFLITQFYIDDDELAHIQNPVEYRVSINESGRSISDNRERRVSGDNFLHRGDQQREELRGFRSNNFKENDQRYDRGTASRGSYSPDAVDRPVSAQIKKRNLSSNAALRYSQNIDTRKNQRPVVYSFQASPPRSVSRIERPPQFVQRSPLIQRDRPLSNSSPSIPKETHNNFARQKILLKPGERFVNGHYLINQFDYQNMVKEGNRKISELYRSDDYQKYLQRIEKSKLKDNAVERERQRRVERKNQEFMEFMEDDVEDFEGVKLRK